MDARQQLEAQLKDTCERFIVAVTKTVVEPMLSFITIVTAVRMPAGDAPHVPRGTKQGVGAGAEDGSGQGGDGPAGMPPLREQVGMVVWRV